MGWGGAGWWIKHMDLGSGLATELTKTYHIIKAVYVSFIREPRTLAWVAWNMLPGFI